MRSARSPISQAGMVSLRKLRKSDLRDTGSERSPAAAQATSSLRQTSGLQSRIKEETQRSLAQLPRALQILPLGPALLRPGLLDTGQGIGLPVNSPLGMKKVRLQLKEFCGFGASSGIILAIRTDFNLKKIMYTIYIRMHVLVYI